VAICSEIVRLSQLQTESRFPRSQSFTQAWLDDSSEGKKQQINSEVAAERLKQSRPVFHFRNPCRKVLRSGKVYPRGAKEESWKVLFDVAATIFYCGR
jgi:hypothetical protein